MLDDPRVAPDVLQVDALLRVLLEELHDQVARERGHEMRELDIDVPDSATRRPLRVLLERRRANQELVQQDAELPHIDARVVLLPSHHFRRKIIERATKSRPAGRRRVHGPPEVRELEVAVQADENVLRLDVAVNDVLRVAVVDCVRHLNDVTRCRLLVEALCVAEHLEELAARGVLDDEVDARLVPEVSVEPDDVRVAEVGLDLDLAAQLAFHGFLLELGFVEDLDSDNEL